MMKQRKGMSLVEVVIAFALVSILIVMVSGAVTSTYQTSYKLQQLPTVYYAGQQAVENELAELDALLEEKYIIEKTIATQTQPDQDLINRLAAINAELVGPVGGEQGNRAREHYTTEIFGKTVNVYRFELDEEIEGVGTVHFYAGTASGVRYERPVPLIDYVTVSDMQGGAPVYVLYDATGTTLWCTPTYIDDANLDYRAMNEDQELDHYLWYTSPAYPDPAVAADMDEVQLKEIVDSRKLHCVYFSDSEHPVTGSIGSDDSIISETMAVFPSNFDGVYETVKRVSSYTVTADDLGKFICCTVTPQSVNDAMGKAVVSNLVYLSALPVLTKADGTTKYRAVIDPSLVWAAESENHLLNTSSLQSWLGTSYFSVHNSSHVVLHQEGSRISSNFDYKSRFYRVDCSNVQANIKPNANDYIFMVVRDKLAARYSSSNSPRGSQGYITNFTGDGILYDTGYRGTGEPYSESGFSPWYLVYKHCTQTPNGNGNGNNYKLSSGTGQEQFDLAELIIVNNPTETEIDEIIQYLADKYELR